MNHLSKQELEKLKVGDILECEVNTLTFSNNTNYEQTTSYFIKIINKKLGRNGYRYITHLYYQKGKMINIIQLDRVFLRFTINGAFTKDGIHNPGPNYLKRKYYKV